jgi:hypothetical protein
MQALGTMSRLQVYIEAAEFAPPQKVIERHETIISPADTITIGIGGREEQAVYAYYVQ